MFRLFPKLPVESYLAFKKLVGRNVSQTINTNGIFPNITKKSLIQSWKPPFSHPIKLPIEDVTIEETSLCGNIWQRLEGVGKDVSSMVMPTRETINKWAGKLMTGKHKRNKFTVKVAGKIRKHIGDFQRAYFRTDVVVLRNCKDGDKKADPESFKKQRKNPKKKLGGQCPYIKEECLRKTGDQPKKKTKGSKQKSGKCSKAVPCGKKGAKKDSGEQKKGKTCGKAEIKSKKDSCSQKKQDDTCRKTKSSTQATCSTKADSCKKTKSTTKAACKGEKPACSSKDDGCKKTKSPTKVCGGEKPICPSPDNTCTKKSSDTFCASKSSNDCSAKNKKGASCAPKKSTGCSAKTDKDASCDSLLKKKGEKPQQKKSCQAMGGRCSKQKASCGAAKKKVICSKKKRAIASEMNTCRPKPKEKECRTAEKKSSKCKQPVVNTCAMKKRSSSKDNDKKCTKSKKTSCSSQEDAEKLIECKQASSSSCASSKSKDSQKKCTQPRKASSEPSAAKKSAEEGCKPTQCRKASSDSSAGKNRPAKRCPSKDNDGKCKLAFTTKEAPKEADPCTVKAGPAKQTRSSCKTARLRSSCKCKAAPQFDFTVPNLCERLPAKERKKCEVQRERWMILKEAWLKQWSKKQC